MQLSAGTFNVQGQNNLGTALLMRIVLPGGAPPTQDVQVTVTGPGGWNGGKPLTANYSANEYASWSLRANVPPVSGAYTATVQVEGRQYTVTSASINTASTLGLPGTITVAEGPNQTVTVGWQAVGGAAVYLERVLRVVENAPDEPVDKASFYTKTTSISFPGTLLATNTSYRADVLAFNAEVNPGGRRALVLPAQFNASVGFTKTFQRVP